MIVGRRCSWSMVFEGQRLEESGRVVEVALAASPASWRVLTLSDAGAFRSPPVDMIKLEPTADEQLEAADANDREAGAAALTALDWLEERLEEQFPDTHAGGGPVEWAASLLGQLKAELLEVGEKRDELAKEVAKLKAKKDKPAKAEESKP